MSVPTLPAAGGRHLSPVADSARLLDATDRLARIETRQALRAAPPRVRLSDWQRMEVEQARKLLMDAPELFATRPAAYVAGLIEGTAQTLLDVLDTVTEA